MQKFIPTCRGSQYLSCQGVSYNWYKINNPNLHGSVEGDVIEGVTLMNEVVALGARVGVLEVLDDA